MKLTVCRHRGILKETYQVVIILTMHTTGEITKPYNIRQDQVSTDTGENSC